VTIFGELSLIMDKVIFLPVTGKNIEVHENDTQIFDMSAKSKKDIKKIKSLQRGQFYD